MRTTGGLKMDFELGMVSHLRRGEFMMEGGRIIMRKDME
jgi:hypothetical protein